MKTSLNKHKRSAAGLLIAVAAFAAALTAVRRISRWTCRWRVAAPGTVAEQRGRLDTRAGLFERRVDGTLHAQREVGVAQQARRLRQPRNRLHLRGQLRYFAQSRGRLPERRTGRHRNVHPSGHRHRTVARVRQTRRSAIEAPSRIFAPIDTNLRYCIDDVEASVTYYDADGVPVNPYPS